MCKTPYCDTIASIKKYQGYCARCFIYMFPESEFVRNHKTKEQSVADYIREQFHDITLTFDKPIQGGCSKRRPDILMDFGEYVLIIEIDENSHENYDCSCENRRLIELFVDAGSRPMVMVRFNPDQYRNHKGRSVPSCWGYTKEKGMCHVKPNKTKEWNKRLEALKNAVQFQIDYAGERKEIDVVHLFYDGYC